MFDNEIVSQGERLKALRKMHRVTQKELCGGICSKENISQIENNKQNLTFDLAVGLIGNLNRIAKEKNINAYLITPEELTKDEDGQANDLFKKHIIKLKEIESIDSFEERLSKAEELIEKYNIEDDSKIELYKLASNFYYYKSSYSKNDEICSKGLKVSINSKNKLKEAHFYISRSRNYIMLEEYSRALEQLVYAEKINDNLMNNELSIMVLHYRALTYKKLGEYDTALEYFKMLKQFEFNDYNMLLKMRMIYANCLNDYNKFEEAEKEYNELINIAIKNDNKDILSLAYKNLSELYFNQEDYNFAAIYIRQAVECNPNNVYLNETLHFAAKVLKNLGEDVEHYLSRALDICEREDRENLNLAEKIIYDLVLLYIEREDEESIMLMADKVKKLNIDYYLIYPEIAEYFRYKNDEISKKFNRISIDKVKQAKKI